MTAVRRRLIPLITASAVAPLEATCWLVANSRVGELRSAISGTGGTILLVLLVALVGIVTALYLHGVARRSVLGCVASLVAAILCVILLEVRWVDQTSFEMQTSDGLFVLPLAGGMIALICISIVAELVLIKRVPSGTERSTLD